MVAVAASDTRRDGSESNAKPPQTTATTEYCAKLQQWIWQNYWGYASWQSWPGTGAHTLGAPDTRHQQQGFPAGSWYHYPTPVSVPASSSHAAGAQTATPGAGRNAPQAGMWAKQWFLQRSVFALSWVMGLLGRRLKSI